jgi:hypothetical protein
VDSETGSWAGYVVRDWIEFAADIPVESAFSARNERDNEQCFKTVPFVSLEMTIFTLAPKRFKFNNWDPNQ